MTKKSNVHPDHYKTGGRDRPDDAAAARLNRAIVAKMASRESPDRLTKKLYFERPEPPGPGAPESPARPMKKRSHAAAGSARKAGPRKATTTKRVAATRKAAARPNRQATKKSGSGRRAKRPSARPSKKR